MFVPVRIRVSLRFFCVFWSENGADEFFCKKLNSSANRKICAPRVVSTLSIILWEQNERAKKSLLCAHAPDHTRSFSALSLNSGSLPGAIRLELHFWFWSFSSNKSTNLVTHAALLEPRLFLCHASRKEEERADCEKEERQQEKGWHTCSSRVKTLSYQIDSEQPNAPTRELHEGGGFKNSSQNSEFLQMSC